MGVGDGPGRWQGAAKRGHRRANERKTAAAGASSGEDQPEPSSRQLVVLDAPPEGELVDLLGERMETQGSGVGQASAAPVNGEGGAAARALVESPANGEGWAAPARALEEEMQWGIF
jgi:hypothetical protein